MKNIYKCTLCGSKLGANKVCTFCGLNNAKQRQYYKPEQVKREFDINQAIDIPRIREGQDAKKVQNSNRKPKKRIVKVIPILIVIATLGVSVLEFIGETVTKSDYESNSNSYISEEPYDEYQYVSRELAEVGTEHQVTLGAGNYRIGVHIPEGNYTVTCESGAGSLVFDDTDNNIYLWRSFYDDDPKEVEDIRLYQGGELSISGSVTLQFHTMNAQTDSMPTVIPNPLTEEIEIWDGAIAGTDFPAGTYDMVATSGYGTVDIFVPGHYYEAEGDSPEVSTLYVSLDEEQLYGSGNTYKNVVMPTGTRIEIKDGPVTVLRPSEFIISTDYMEYYGGNY